jgi:hypothetical protein
MKEKIRSLCENFVIVVNHPSLIKCRWQGITFLLSNAAWLDSGNV